MSLYLADAAATLAFGRQLASWLPAASTLLLHGDLGAGKTCLVQGLAAGPLIPLSQVLLLSSYTPARAGTAMAAWGMTVLVAPTP